MNKHQNLTMKNHQAKCLTMESRLRTERFVLRGETAKNFDNKGHIALDFLSLWRESTGFYLVQRTSLATDIAPNVKTRIVQ
jgi:hypothetical protein